MASLAQASSDFVDVLRQGLEAYDAGDKERAYAIFDEALEIEPDNVWGLLWKGATAPTPADSKLWLEQAIAIDPNNDHARAGLQWANELLAGSPAMSLAPTMPPTRDSAPERSGTVGEPVIPAAEGMVFETAERRESAPFDMPSDIADEEAGAFPDWLVGDEGTVAGESVGGEDGLPDWLSGGTTTQDEADEGDMPDWLSGETAATGDDGGELPSWLSEGQTAVADGQEGELPDWLSSSEPAVAEASEGSLPDWLGGETALADEGEMPDWLSGGEATTTSDEGGELPSWLSEGEAAVAEEGSLALPDWLSEGESATVDDSAADLPDWLTGGQAATKEPEAEAMPDWLSDSGSLTAPPVRPGSEAQADLPSWLVGDGEQEFQAQRAKGSLEASSDIVAAYQSGLLAYEEDRLDDATVAFQRVIRLDPNHVEAHNYLGSVFYLNGRPNDAIGALQRALELDSSHTESYLNLGLVYKETERSQEAVQMFRRYLELAPEGDSTAMYVRDLIQELDG